MVCHYFQLDELQPAQMTKLSHMLDGMAVGTGSAPPMPHMQTSLLTRLELTPAQVEQLCAECDSVESLLEALAKRITGSDPTYANPLAPHAHAVPPKRASRAPSTSAFSLPSVFGGGGGGGGASVPQTPGARKLSSGGFGHGSTTVTVTRSVGQDAPGASRLASSGRAFSDGGLLLDDAVR